MSCVFIFILLCMVWMLSSSTRYVVKSKIFDWQLLKGSSVLLNENGTLIDDGIISSEECEVGEYFTIKEKIVISNFDWNNVTSGMRNYRLEWSDVAW